MNNNYDDLREQLFFEYECAKEQLEAYEEAFNELKGIKGRAVERDRNEISQKILHVSGTIFAYESLISKVYSIEGKDDWPYVISFK